MRIRQHRLHVAVAERLSQLPSDAWDTLTAEAGVFLRRGFLAAFEDAPPAELSPRYVLLSDDAGAPVAAAVAQLVHVRGRRAVAKGAQALPGAVRGLAPLVDERALVLGNLAAWDDAGVALARDAEPTQAWLALADAVDRLRRAERGEGHVNVAALKDVAVAPAAQATLRARGYAPVSAGATLTLALAPAWRSTQDYLAAMTAHARCAVKKTLTQVDRAGFAVRSLAAADAASQVDVLDRLYRQVWHRADVRPLTLSGAFFVALKRRLGDDCALLALEGPAGVAGFITVLRSGDTAVAYYLGFDRDVAAPLYHRLLLASVEQALAWGCRRVSMGRTCEDTKARLGATATPTQLWLRHRVPPFNWGLGAVLGALPTPPAMEATRVFKDVGSRAG